MHRPRSRPEGTIAYSPGFQSGRRGGQIFSILFALCALPFIWRVSRNVALSLRFEDALIVLRYARNIAAGEGFVFNPGERVLGVTTPLHTLLSALYVRLAGEAAAAMQNVAGVVFLVLEAWLAALILKRVYPALLAALAAVLIVTNLNLNYLYFGMETHLFAVLALMACHLWTQRRYAWTGAVLGVAFLTRYDAALLALLIGLTLWPERKKLARLTAAFFTVVTPWLLFAQVYFGSILPHALGAKKDYYPALAYLRRVFEYYQETFAALAGVFTSSAGVQTAAAWLFPLICLAGVTGLVRRARVAPEARATKGLLILVAFAALQVLTYAALGPDPAFRWHYYLLNPVLTLLFLAGLYELASLAWRLAWRDKAAPRASSAFPAVALLTALALAGWNLHRQLDYVHRLDPHSAQMFEIAAWLDARYGQDTSLLQPSIGILGYATDLRIIDHAGLVTPGLFYYDGSNHTPMADVLERYRPDLALVPEGAGHVVLEQHGYRRVAAFTDPVTYLLYERPRFL